MNKLRYSQSTIDVATVQAILKRLGHGVASHHDSMVDTVFGTQDAPGIHPVYLYAESPTSAAQTVTPINNLVEVLSFLFRNEWGTSHYENDKDLGNEMRRRVRILRDDTGHSGQSVLEPSFGEEANSDNRSYGRAHGRNQSPGQAEPNNRNAPARLFSPSPTTLDAEAHQLRTLGNIAKDVRLEEKDKFAAEKTSLSEINNLLNRIFTAVPSALRIVLDGEETYEEKDACLRSILFACVSKSLMRDFYGERVDVTHKTAHSVYVWITDKCSQFAAIQANRLMASLTTTKFDDKGGASARAFLLTWQERTRDLQGFKGDSWTGEDKFENLRIAIGYHPSFSQIFGEFARSLRNNKEKATEDVFTRFFSDVMDIAMGYDLGRNSSPGAADVRALAVQKGSTESRRRLFACFACGEWGHTVRDCTDENAKKALAESGKKATPKALATAHHAVLLLSDDEVESDDSE